MDAFLIEHYSDWQILTIIEEKDKEYLFKIKPENSDLAMEKKHNPSLIKRLENFLCGDEIEEKILLEVDNSSGASYASPNKTKQKKKK